jgi:hypothetical protein
VSALPLRFVICVEAAAPEFGLHVKPIVDEDYFLVCLKRNLEHPAVLSLRSLLASEAWAIDRGFARISAGKSAEGSSQPLLPVEAWYRAWSVLAGHPYPCNRSAVFSSSSRSCRR